VQGLEKRQNSRAVRKVAARHLADNERMDNHAPGAQRFRQMQIAAAQTGIRTG
jgi:hypothetical protein